MTPHLQRLIKQIANVLHADTFPLHMLVTYCVVVRIFNMNQAFIFWSIVVYAHILVHVSFNYDHTGLGSTFLVSTASNLIFLGLNFDIVLGDFLFAAVLRAMLFSFLTLAYLRVEGKKPIEDLESAQRPMTRQENGYVWTSLTYLNGLKVLCYESRY